MFLPFAISNKTIQNLKISNKVHPISVENRKKGIKHMLERYLIGDGNSIDGSLLQSEWFPIDEFHYNVFISHSHNDFEEAKYLCAYLEQICGLSCFIDEFAWKSADNLLRQIDNKYCLIRELSGKTYKGYGRNTKKHYDYKKRNYTTSHIHAMLSMAILEIMDKCECVIFIDSDQSVRKNKFGSMSTLSPWLYEETRFMRMLKPRIPERFLHELITKAFTAESLEYVHDNRSDDISFKYKIDDVKELDVITFNLLSKMNNHKGVDALDYLYRSSKYYCEVSQNGQQILCD